MKTQVLAAMKETGLNRWANIQAALAANDRIKYYLTLLQTAVSRAAHPEQAINSLRRERLVSGVENAGFDDLVAQSRREDGQYRIPGCGEIFAQIVHELRVMAAPVVARNGGPNSKDEFEVRLERILAKFPKAQDDLVDAAAIDDLTRVGQGKSDTLHRLVMDLHKTLNAMQVEMAEERLDGADVYHIEESDRPMIAAFMSGLNRTFPLKFNHPGLGTTATRTGNRLIIQNDLGSTDAHVMVIHIEGMKVRIIHTDVHPERIEFLCKMLKKYSVSWGEEQSMRTDSLASGVPFELIHGQFDAKDFNELLEYLNFLGSRLVFLIDWNRARKDLRGFLRAKDRVALLEWAAEAEVGQRGFLELGGAQLVNRAIEDTSGSAMHFGDRLCDVLGDDAAMDFLRFAFRAAMEGLRDHQSSDLIQDRIRAELQAHFSSEGKRLFHLASEQAAMIFEIATLVRDGVHSIGFGDSNEKYQQLASRARGFEHGADQLVAASREATRRRPEYTPVFRILETADNAADELEEVAFLIDLLVTSGPAGDALQALGALADLVFEASQEWVKALSFASRVDKPVGAGAQDDVRDFLTAIDALFLLEHRADDAERALTYASVQKAGDFRQLHIYSKIGDSLEEASDALKWAGLNARDYLLGSVLSV